MLNPPYLEVLSADFLAVFNAKFASNSEVCAGHCILVSRMANYGSIKRLNIIASSAPFCAGLGANRMSTDLIKMLSTSTFGFSKHIY
jgi:hypothetical protein